MQISIRLKNIGRPDSLRYMAKGYGPEHVAEFEVTINGVSSDLWVPLPRGSRLDDPDIGKVLRTHCHETFQEIVRQTADWAAPPSE